MIETKSRVITCKCNKETSTFWVMRKNDSTKLGIRCDACFNSEGEIKFKPYWEK